jgi:allophanate hydrolase subunit 2
MHFPVPAFARGVGQVPEDEKPISLMRRSDIGGSPAIPAQSVPRLGQAPENVSKEPSIVN